MPSAPSTSKTKRNIKRIIFSGDFLRPIENDFRPSQTENILWFYHLFRRGVAEATQLPTQVVSWNEGIDVTDFYQRLAASFDISGWVQIYDSDQMPEIALTALAETFSQSLVIGFELAESVKHALTKLGIVYVDFNIHPIRFLDDVLFAAQSNSEDVYSAFAKYHVSHKQFWRGADMVRASCLKLSRPQVTANTLILGQVGIDRSLIRDSSLVDLRAFREELRSIVGLKNKFMFKPHPYSRGSFGLYRSGIPFQNIVKTTENVYKLLSHDSLTRFIAVSSSVVQEAAFFEKEGIALHTPPLKIVDRADSLVLGSHASISNAPFADDFWRDLLRPLVRVTKNDNEPPSHCPNRLRTSLQNFWGFNEITTDVYTKLYETSKNLAR